jgi:hypothetical protein
LESNNPRHPRHKRCAREKRHPPLTAKLHGTHDASKVWFFSSTKIANKSCTWNLFFCSGTDNKTAAMRNPADPQQLLRKKIQKKNRETLNPKTLKPPPL